MFLPDASGLTELSDDPAALPVGGKAFLRKATGIQWRKTPSMFTQHNVMQYWLSCTHSQSFQKLLTCNVFETNYQYLQALTYVSFIIIFWEINICGIAKARLQEQSYSPTFMRIARGKLIKLSSKSNSISCKRRSKI